MLQEIVQIRWNSFIGRYKKPVNVSPRAGVAR
jgi:hypothetical protein